MNHDSYTRFNVFRPHAAAFLIALLPLFGCGTSTRAATAAAAAPESPAATPAPGAAAPAVAARALAPTTTMAGVFSMAQAGRGRDMFASTCSSCHTLDSEVGTLFNVRWNGHPVSDLFTFVSTKMPQNAPGSLEPSQVADVVAYLLRMNSMPPGQADLPADADSLTEIRIDHRPSSGAAGPPPGPTPD